MKLPWPVKLFIAFLVTFVLLYVFGYAMSGGHFVVVTHVPTLLAALAVITAIAFLVKSWLDQHIADS